MADHPTEFVKSKDFVEDITDVEDATDAPAPYVDETIFRIKQQLAELRSCVYVLAVSVAALAGGVIALARR